MKNIIIALSIALLTGALGSCNKAPGEGGTSTIKGKILTINLNEAGDTVVPPYYAMDEDVYIIYGTESKTYNDKFSCSYDGSFQFNFLVPGAYTIFVYSECHACPTNKDIQQRTVEINKKGEVIDLGDIIIYE